MQCSELQKKEMKKTVGNMLRKHAEMFPALLIRASRFAVEKKKKKQETRLNIAQKLLLMKKISRIAFGFGYIIGGN
jgi:hypothetical protein